MNNEEHKRQEKFAKEFVKGLDLDQIGGAFTEETEIPCLLENDDVSIEISESTQFNKIDVKITIERSKLKGLYNVLEHFGLLTK